MQKLTAYLISQLQQPSTWRGLVLMLTAYGVKLAPEQFEAIITLGIFLAGAVGATFPDKISKQ